MDATAWTIIGAMGTAIVGLAGFVGKLYADLKEARRDLVECQEARITQAQEHYRELSTLKDMILKRKGNSP